jgi:hypothetical protein
MNKFTSFYMAAWLAPLLTIASNQAHAVAHPFEFHADAKMAHQEQGPVDKAYGYMNVITDEDGNGSINVMFSNASRVNEAGFNASVKFFDTAGAVVREESFNCWMDSTGIEGPIECLVSKPLMTSNFESIQVDFFLSE